jgi:hypothetical protein
MENTESNMEKPGNSTKKMVVRFLPHEKTNLPYLGEYYVEDNKLQVRGINNEQKTLLLGCLRDLWIPQLGIPVLEKQKGEFVKSDAGKFVTNKYSNPGNSTPDELIEALYELFRALGSFDVRLEDV